MGKVIEPDAELRLTNSPVKFTVTDDELATLLSLCQQKKIELIGRIETLCGSRPAQNGHYEAMIDERRAELRKVEKLHRKFSVESS